MYQKVIICGNLGNEPTLRYLPDGTPVASFSVATNRRWSNGEDEQNQETVWFQVSAWGKIGESCNQHLTKGRQVLVEARLIPDKETGGPRIWEDDNKEARASFELRALTVQFLGNSPNQQSSHEDKG